MKFSENLNLPILQDGDKYSKEIQNEAFNTIDKECTNIKNTIKSVLDINNDVTDAIKTLGDISEELSDLKEKQNEDYYELLESNNYIGNKIRDINSQLDTIKTNKVDKEEGKQLSTNDFDNNLLALLRSWEEFKTNGGEIGGAINFTSGATIDNITKPITISGNTMYYRENVTNNAGFSHLSRFEDDSLGGKVNQNGIEFRKNYGGTSGSFRPMVDNALDLGSLNYTWKDIYLNGMYRNSPNGYSKLPNGLILQWVRAEVTTTGYHKIQLPLAFPNKLCGFISEVGGRDSNSNPQPVGAYSNISGSTTSSCQVRIGALGTNNVDRVFINIIAIGY